MFFLGRKMARIVARRSFFVMIPRLPSVLTLISWTNEKVSAFLFSYVVYFDAHARIKIGEAQTFYEAQKGSHYRLNLYNVLPHSNFFYNRLFVTLFAAL